MEQNHAALAKDVASLAGTVSRVETNQKHAEELSKLRFDSLDVSVGTIRETLDRFMGRINAIISGEVRLPQSEQMMTDYFNWRAGVDRSLDEQAVLNGQVRMLGRLAVLLVSTNVVAVVAAVFALASP